MSSSVPGPPRQEVLTVAKDLWPAYLLASVLIFVGFGWSLPDGVYIERSFFADENASVWAVQQISFPRFDPSWLTWGTALFYQVYLVKTIVTLGGIVPMGSSGIIVIGRLIGYVSAMGCLTLVYGLGRRLFDCWTGRVAAITLAVLPGFVINSHYFKTDLPVTFWLLAALLAAYMLISSGKFANVLLLGLLVGYSASVKYSAGVLFPAGLVAVTMADAKLPRLKGWVAYAAAVAAGFLIGTPHAVDVGRLLGRLEWVAEINRRGIAHHAARPAGWADYLINVFPFSMTLPLLVTAVAAVVWVAIKRGRLLLPIWVFLAAYYLLMGTDNFRQVRYTVPLLPFAALFIAYLFRSLKDLRRVRVVAISGLSVMLAYAFLFSLSYVRVMAQVDPRVQASRWIEDNLPADQPLPIIPAHYLNYPQFPTIGYETVDVGHSVEMLDEAESPYLILTEFGTLPYEEAMDQHPEQREFFAHLSDSYREVARFENSQALLGIDSKRGERLPFDWLMPNPRITILQRRH